MENDVAVIVCLDVVESHDSWVIGGIVVGTRHLGAAIQSRNQFFGVGRFEQVLQ